MQQVVDSPAVLAFLGVVLYCHFAGRVTLGHR